MQIKKKKDFTFEAIFGIRPKFRLSNFSTVPNRLQLTSKKIGELLYSNTDMI